MAINYGYLAPTPMGPAGMFMGPLDAHKDLFKNFSKNKDPSFALNPFQRGSIVNTAESFTPHGQIMRAFGLGKGGGQQGTAYAANEFDIASAQARNDIEKYMRGTQAMQKQDYQDQIQRGIQERVATKMMENARKVGPNLKGTEVRGMPAWMKPSGPLNYSGADRGTLHGAALEDALKEGKMSTPEIKVELGAKGSPTGLAEEAIPKFQNKFLIDPLTPAAQLHAGAQMQAQAMNKPKGK